MENIDVKIHLFFWGPGGEGDIVEATKKFQVPFVPRKGDKVFVAGTADGEGVLGVVEDAILFLEENSIDIHLEGRVELGLWKMFEGWDGNVRN